MITLHRAMQEIQQAECDCLADPCCLTGAVIVALVARVASAVFLAIQLLVVPIFLLTWYAGLILDHPEIQQNCTTIGAAVTVLCLGILASLAGILLPEALYRQDGGAYYMFDEMQEECVRTPEELEVIKEKKAEQARKKEADESRGKAIAEKKKISAAIRNLPFYSGYELGEQIDHLISQISHAPLGMGHEALQEAWDRVLDIESLKSLSRQDLAWLMSNGLLTLPPDHIHIPGDPYSERRFLDQLESNGIPQSDLARAKNRLDQKRIEEMQPSLFELLLTARTKMKNFYLQTNVGKEALKTYKNETQISDMGILEGV